MKIKIICISDSDKHFGSAIQEYTKRMGKDIEIIDIKPEKNGNKDQIIGKETDKIIKQLEKSDYFVILLSKEGKEYDTMQIRDIVAQNSKILFIIGGPYGIEETKLDKYIHAKIRFGKITLPHGLAKLVLLEQIFRCQTIIDNKQYHY